MNKLRDKHLALLDRCRQQGYLSPIDVDIVYSFSEPRTYWQSRKLGKIKLQVLRNLELNGYLVRVTESKWKITQKGIDELNKYARAKGRRVKKISMKRIDNSSVIIPCDMCLKRPAVYLIEKDNTRLCDICLTRYLVEHGIKAYEVRLA